MLIKKKRNVRIKLYITHAVSTSTRNTEFSRASIASYT